MAVAFELRKNKNVEIKKKKIASLSTLFNTLIQWFRAQILQNPPKSPAASVRLKMPPY